MSLFSAHWPEKNIEKSCFELTPLIDIGFPRFVEFGNDEAKHPDDDVTLEELRTLLIYNGIIKETQGLGKQELTDALKKWKSEITDLTAKKGDLEKENASLRDENLELKHELGKYKSKRFIINFKRKK